MSNAPGQGSRVRLNVGGARFETTWDTLAKYPDTYFSRMLSGSHNIDLDEDGYIFIDRDGAHFAAILNFLRSGTLIQPESARARQALQVELDYYGVMVADAAKLQVPDLTRTDMVNHILAKGSKLSLRGVRLVGLDLSGLSLPRCDFTGADLRGADLRRATLNGACLAGADLSSVDASGADLSGADLSGAKTAGLDLTGAQFSEPAMLVGIDITQIKFDADFDLRGAASSLARSCLRGLNLVPHLPGERRVDLGGADLRDVVLDGVDLGRANLSGANLTGAQCRGTKFQHANLVNTNFTSADLSSSILVVRRNFRDRRNYRDEQYVLEGVSWRGATFAGANLSRAWVDEAYARFADVHGLPTAVEGGYTRKRYYPARIRAPGDNSYSSDEFAGDDD